MSQCNIDLPAAWLGGYVQRGPTVDPYDLLDEQHRFASIPELRACHRRRRAGAAMVLTQVHALTGRQRNLGMYLSSSQLSVAVGPAILRRRRKEWGRLVETAMLAAPVADRRRQGNVIDWCLTLGAVRDWAPRSIGQSWFDHVATLLLALSKLGHSSAALDRWKTKWDFLGWVRSIDLVVSKQGKPHPHAHVLGFFDRIITSRGGGRPKEHEKRTGCRCDDCVCHRGDCPPGECELCECRRELAAIWCEIVKTVGQEFGTTAMPAAQHAQIVYSPAIVSYYTKLADPHLNADTKGLTLYDLLHLLKYGSEEEAVWAYEHYAGMTGAFGRIRQEAGRERLPRLTQVSPGLFKHFGLEPGQSDTVIARQRAISAYVTYWGLSDEYVEIIYANGGAAVYRKLVKQKDWSVIAHQFAEWCGTNPASALNDYPVIEVEDCSGEITPYTLREGVSEAGESAAAAVAAIDPAGGEPADAAPATRPPASRQRTRRGPECYSWAVAPTSHHKRRRPAPRRGAAAYPAPRAMAPSRQPIRRRSRGPESPDRTSPPRRIGPAPP